MERISTNLRPPLQVVPSINGFDDKATRPFEEDFSKWMLFLLHPHDGNIKILQSIEATAPSWRRLCLIRYFQRRSSSRSCASKTSGDFKHQKHRVVSVGNAQSTPTSQQRMNEVNKLLDHEIDANIDEHLIDNLEQLLASEDVGWSEGLSRCCRVASIIHP